MYWREFPCFPEFDPDFLSLTLFTYRWLDEGQDDGKIVRELKVQEEYMDDILEKRNVSSPDTW